MLGCACLVIRRLPVFFCTKYSGVKKVGGQCVATVLLLPMMPSDSLISIHTLRPARDMSKCRPVKKTGVAH